MLDARSGKSNHATFTPDSVTESVIEQKTLTNNLSTPPYPHPLPNAPTCDLTLS